MRMRFVWATVGGLVACGLPYWPIPYREVRMPGNPSTELWLVLGALAGLLAGYLLRHKAWLPVLAVTAGFDLAVLLRVAVETTRDPTSHNLWPFEVVIAGSIGFAGAVVGVTVARVIQWATATPRSSSEPAA
jgi:hypothetical protein